MRQGRLREAVSRISEALKIRADYPDAHNNLGVALMRQGRYKEAGGHFEEALRLRPGYRDAQKNRDLVLRLMGSGAGHPVAKKPGAP
jgi:Flp pilus assembly protein TadD